MSMIPNKGPQMTNSLAILSKIKAKINDGQPLQVQQ